MSPNLTAIHNSLAEEIAYRMLRYQSILLTHKVIISRLNPDEVEEAVESVRQMLQIADSWHLPWSENDMDEFLADCDWLCSTPPDSLAERTKILYGAWTALNYILISMAPRLPLGVWKAAQKRYYELANQRFPHPSPLMKPPGRLRPLTEIERESFKNPDNLFGKHFVLFPGTENEMGYKVIGCTIAEDNSLNYTVLFHDCDDFLMEEHEITSQLAISLIYED